MIFNLKGKVVIIVGGNGLIGRTVIKDIIQNNGTVIMADINEKESINFIKELKINHKNSIIDFVNLDVTNKETIVNAINFVEKKYNKIDALVNMSYPKNKNWGSNGGYLENIIYESFCENLNLHLGGCFLVAQQIALFFKKQGYGNIINTSSIYGVIAPRFDIYENTGMTNSIEYAAIKSAIIHMTKYIAKYYKNENIRCNCISPAGIFDNQNSEFIKKYKKYSSSKGMLDADDITGTVIYLLSDMSKYVNGQNLVVDDGWTL